MSAAAQIAANTFALIQAHVRDGNLGQVFDQSQSYEVPRRPGRIRRPAVSFLRRGRLPDGSPPKPIRLIPDFALLIVAPEQLAEDLQRTIYETISGYSQLIWVVYPRLGTVQVFRECGISRYLYQGEELDGGSVFPDLMLPTEASSRAPMANRGPSMNSHYVIRDTSAIFTPALLFYKDLIRQNIARAVEIAGAARSAAAARQDAQDARNRPHGTRRRHPQAQVRHPRRGRDAGQAGAPDVLLAYNLVGPNCGRLARLIRTYPDCRFSVLADHPVGARSRCPRRWPLREQQRGCAARSRRGPAPHRHRPRTGSRRAVRVVWSRCPGLTARRLARLRWPQSSGELRRTAGGGPARCWSRSSLCARPLEKKGLPVPRIVAGGTPTFPVYARLDLPGLECSPGTCFLHDDGYGSRFADLAGFRPRPCCSRASSAGRRRRG